MKILSANVRGLGGQSKQLSLKKLINLEKLEIIVLQETMGIDEPLIFYFKKLLGG
jgi:exonuclease III